MRDQILDSGYVQCDETRVQVLNEKGKPAESQSYMWVEARMGPQPLILYEYDPSRSSKVPKRLLEGYQGYLQVDGYEGYNRVCQNPRVLRVGCAAHIRRKFFEASEASKQQGVGNKGLKFFHPLYQIEKEAREKKLSFSDRYDLRQKQAKPLIEEMKRWLDDIHLKITPQLASGKAVQYALGQWAYWTRYLEDGLLEIDNHFIEGKIRPFALGRKNGLFSATVDGANASATLYSLIETTKTAGLNPYDYLKKIFEVLPLARSLEDFEALLPYTLHL